MYYEQVVLTMDTVSQYLGRMSISLCSFLIPVHLHGSRHTLCNGLNFWQLHRGNCIESQLHSWPRCSCSVDLLIFWWQTMQHRRIDMISTGDGPHSQKMRTATTSAPHTMSCASQLESILEKTLLHICAMA